jgi:hypothetical protein
MRVVDYIMSAFDAERETAQRFRLRGKVAYSLSSILGEVVSGQECSSDTGVETSETVIGGIYDSVLETTGVFEVEVELAVL